MSALFLIIFCLILGVLLQLLPAFPKEAHKGLNAYLIYVALPAITLRFLPGLTLSWDLLMPASMAWLVFGLAWLFFTLLGNRLGWPRATIACLIMVAGLGNTSFVGFPLIKAWFGEAGLQLAVLCDQPGSFLVLSTLGILVMSWGVTGTWNPGVVGPELLRFPPFLAFLAALLMVFLDLKWPPEMEDTLSALGSTLTPVAMLSVGLQLRSPWKGDAPWKQLGWGLLFKLGLAPVMIAGLYIGLLRQEGLWRARSPFWKLPCRR